ncbi:MAG: helix-turn-helix transcriptional regulator, partial [Chloroflexi bacterium]|nr:helix-turn-helix transcriptional regulator [Chloroflexota bacterium]
MAAESFRGLLLRYRGRTGLTQRQLAARLAVDRRTVQDWEVGVKFPTAGRLRALIVALLEQGGLTQGEEIVEAQALWSAARREAPRMHTPFDDEWFAELIASHASSPSPQTAHALDARGTAWPATRSGEHEADWGDAPDTLGFVGRARELRLLNRWVAEERCGLVVVRGFG